MTKFLKRMTVMSVALVLLCVAVAQDEKSTKSVTNARNYSHGVTVNPDFVTLEPGQIAIVNVVTEPGYRDPLLIHAGQNLTINDSIISTSHFTARIKNKNSGGATIEIEANEYISETKEDYIYVKAMMISGTSRNLPSDYLGVPIQIVVFSDYK